jgi:hypothetical protein
MFPSAKQLSRRSPIDACPVALRKVERFVSMSGQTIPKATKILTGRSLPLATSWQTPRRQMLAAPSGPTS